MAPELPAGTRSVAFRLTFRAPDRTLRDAEVDAAETRLLAALEPRSWECGGAMPATPARETDVTYSYERPDSRRWPSWSSCSAIDRGAGRLAAAHA